MPEIDGTSILTEPILEPANGAIDDRFRRLVMRWKQDTEFSSSVTEMSMHPAYQQIIGMGPPVLPLLFRELATSPDHWFWALAVITGTDPVRAASRGNLDEMTAAWLAWGREHGHVT